MNATIKEVDLKGKFCIEITPAAGGKKKNKDKLYVFQVEKEHDRERWVACLRKAAAYRTPVPLELGDGTGAAGTGNGDVAHHDNPLHSDSGSPRSKSQSMDADDDEDGNISSFRTMSSSSFRMTNMIPTEKEGYLMKKSPALMKGWQKRYFVTNKETGDIDYYKTVRPNHILACVALSHLRGCDGSMSNANVGGGREERGQGGAAGHDPPARHQGGLRPGGGRPLARDHHQHGDQERVPEGRLARGRARLGHEHHCVDGELRGSQRLDGRCQLVTGVHQQRILLEGVRRRLKCSHPAGRDVGNRSVRA